MDRTVDDDADRAELCRPQPDEGAQPPLADDVALRQQRRLRLGLRQRRQRVAQLEPRDPAPRAEEQRDDDSEDGAADQGRV
jgi:hypothetical protein